MEHRLPTLSHCSLIVTGYGSVIGQGGSTVVVYWNGGCNEVMAYIYTTSNWYVYYYSLNFVTSNASISYNTDSFSVFDYYTGDAGHRMNQLCGVATPYNGVGYWSCGGYLAWI